LWTTYFTSSKVVQEYREKYGEPDVVEVRQTFPTDTLSRSWESKVLKRVGAVKSERWLNLSSGGSDFCCVIKTDEHKQKIAKALTGKSKSKETRTKLSIARRGKTNSVESNIKRGLAQRGKIVSEESRAKMSISSKGKQASEESRAKMSVSKMGSKNPNFDTIWITNGQYNNRIKKDDIIPIGWKRGRIL
jgi:hypothetical protein